MSNGSYLTIEIFRFSMEVKGRDSIRTIKMQMPIAIESLKSAFFYETVINSLWHFTSMDRINVILSNCSLAAACFNFYIWLENIHSKYALSHTGHGKYFILGLCGYSYRNLLCLCGSPINESTSMSSDWNKILFGIVWMQTRYRLSTASHRCCMAYNTHIFDRVICIIWLLHSNSDFESWHWKWLTYTSYILYMVYIQATCMYVFECVGVHT